MTFIQVEGEAGMSDDRESRLFPDSDQSDQRITCHVMTSEFLIYGTEV